MPTRALAVQELLPESHAWFWWLDSKAGCIAAIPHMPPAIRKHVCCYGWSDLAYLPRHAHKLFRSAVRNGFWNVQVRACAELPWLARLAASSSVFGLVRSAEGAP